MSFRTFFHYISYIQYPLIAVAGFFVFKPYIGGFQHLEGNLDLVFQSYNTALIFFGIAVSFSSLQDTTKTQNEFSRKIWAHPTKGKIMIIVMSIFVAITLSTGLVGYFNTQEGILHEISAGAIVLSIGLLGLLKAAKEMFENHRIDKNPPISSE